MKEPTTTHRETISQRVFIQKTHNFILKSNSCNTNLARGSVHTSKIGWAHGKNIYLTQISNQGAQGDLKMYETSKEKYLQIYKLPFKNVIFLTIKYKMYLKIVQKLRCLVAFQQTLRSAVMKISWISNSSKDNFVKKSLPLSTKRKLPVSILLNFPFPSVSFSVVNLAMRNTGLVNHRMSCLTFEDFCLGLTFSLGPRDPKRDLGTSKGQSREGGASNRGKNTPARSHCSFGEPVH